MYKGDSRVIYKEKGVEITSTFFSDLPILSYVTYSDSDISISFEYSTLLFTEGLDSDIAKDVLNNNNDDFLIEATKKSVVRPLKQYRLGVKEGSPETAFIYHSKRDLTRQIYLAMCNRVFDDLTMYNYICTSYSTIECGYGYSTLFDLLNILKEGAYSDVITSNLLLSLGDKVVDNYVEVYRGINNKNREDGLSYTFSLKTAIFFANRWGVKGVVKKYKIHVDDIVAYISVRGEDEVLSDNAEYLSTVDISDLDID